MSSRLTGFCRDSTRNKNLEGLERGMERIKGRGKNRTLFMMGV